MSLLIDSGVVAVIRELEMVAPDASDKLLTSPDPYYPAKGAFTVKKRRHITLSSDFNGFNPPLEMKLPKDIFKGWRLAAQPFFLTNDGEVLINWDAPKYFSTTVCLSTAETVSIFFTKEHLKFALDELIDIAHP